MDVVLGGRWWVNYLLVLIRVLLHTAALRSAYLSLSTLQPVCIFAAFPFFFFSVFCLSPGTITNLTSFSGIESVS